MTIEIAASPAIDFTGGSGCRGAAQPGAQSGRSGSWKVPRHALGGADLQGVWTSADPARRAPTRRGRPRPRPPEPGGLQDVNPTEPLGRANSARDVPGRADDTAGAGACRDAEARVRQFHDRQLRRPREAGTWVRCLSRGMPGAMTPTAYNNNYQIVQSQDYVAVTAEMIHDVRMIPLRTQPHIGPSIRQWLGDSRGLWDGDTLVVEGTNV